MFPPSFSAVEDIGPVILLGALAGAGWEAFGRKRRITVKRLGKAVAMGAVAGAGAGIVLPLVGVDVSDMMPPALLDVFDAIIPGGDGMPVADAGQLLPG